MILEFWAIVSVAAVGAFAGVVLIRAWQCRPAAIEATARSRQPQPDLAAHLAMVGQAIDRQQRIHDRMLAAVESAERRMTDHPIPAKGFYVAGKLIVPVEVDTDRLIDLARELGIRKGDGIGSNRIIELVVDAAIHSPEEFALHFRGYIETSLEMERGRPAGRDDRGPAEQED